MDISSTWLLLVLSLPTNGATARMRIWRTLKGLGCCALRDGAYLLPDLVSLRTELDALASETVREGGSAWLLTVHAETDEQNLAYQLLFGRSDEYAVFTNSLLGVRKELATTTAAELNRALRKLRREYEAIRAIDYFPNEASAIAASTWQEFVTAAEAVLSPGEPQAVSRPVPVLDSLAYQGRIWATRRHLWVDRAASAWLIKRFIDTQATFVWLNTPADCPSAALGFDFDQAAFTHVGDRVTFEVLLASFGLEQNQALVRLGTMVHALDVGGAFVPEAAGFEAVLRGVRERAPTDDELMVSMSLVLDSLYVHFSNEQQDRQEKAGKNERRDA